MSCRNESIKNKAVLVFDVFGKSHTIESNEVEANKVCLRIIKEQDHNIVFAGDKICYKITIYNDSCIDLCDLDFRDRLDSDVKYEWNSFKVNGECKSAEISGRTVCYHINRLKAKEATVLSFEVEVE